jgi:hypothetical protein
VITIYPVPANTGDQTVADCWAPIAGTPGVGAMYIFSDEGKTWAQQKLTDGASGDGFGGSVALSGNTAVVGAIGQDPGSVYVFFSSPGTWRQVPELTPADPTSQPGGGSEQFGYAVDVSEDNAIVGANSAYNNSSNGRNTSNGRIYLYSKRSRRLVLARTSPPSPLNLTHPPTSAASATTSLTFPRPRRS